MKKFNLKNIKYGSNSVVMVAVVVAIVIVLNVLVSLFDYNWDLTRNSLFSLSNQSLKIIEKVEKEDNVTIVALYDKNTTELSLYTNVIEKYSEAGGDKLQVKYFNPTNNPGVYAELGIDKLVSANETSAYKKPIFVIQGNGRSKLITEPELYIESTTTDDYGNEETENKLNIEAAVTGAINNVISDFKPKAYWLEGHGELPIEGNYEEIKKFLELNNYSFGGLNILSSGKIPKDCSILVCASPESDWSDDEKDIIFKYLNAGGSLFLMMDAAENNVKFTNVKKIINEYNLDFDNNKLVETAQDYVLSNDKRAFFSSAVSTKMNQPVADYKVLIRNARSIKLLNNNLENVNAVGLLATTEAAYTEDLVTAERLYGVQYAAAAADRRPGGVLTRAIVMGDSGFMNDGTITGLGGNSNYTTKTVLTYFNWLVNEDSGVVISPKSINNDTLIITQDQLVVSNYITMIFIPVGILLLGLFIWIRRRHK